MAGMWQDIRYAMRGFLRQPLFTLVALGTLAIGVGANAAIFSVVHSTLVRVMPFPNGDRLAYLWYASDNRSLMRTPPFQALDALRAAPSLEAIEPYTSKNWVLTGGTEPEVLDVALVTPGLLRMAPLPPTLGRLFANEEGIAGRDRVVLLSDALWRRRFGADPNVVGTTIHLHDAPYEVLGVLPRSADRLFTGRQTDAWVPLAPGPEGVVGSNVLALLTRGTTIEQANAELAGIDDGLPAPRQGETVWVPRVVSPETMFGGNYKTGTLILFGAVGLVLLIACANVANMLLARGVGRRHEMAMRLAIGANRWRLTRQLLTEHLLLAVAGSAAGIAVAGGGLRLIQAIRPAQLSQLEGVVISGTVLWFTVGVSLLTTLLFGLAPILQALRVDVGEALAQGTRTGSGASSWRLRQSLMAVEVALAVVLFVGAGLMVRSFLRLQRVDPGVTPEHVATLNLTLPEARYPDSAQQAAFFGALIADLERLPGVESAALTKGTPPSLGVFFITTMAVDGRDLEPAELSSLIAAGYVGPDYFRTVGTRLVEGQSFETGEGTPGSIPVVVNATFAKHFWPDGSAIGKQLEMSGRAPFTIVGVAQDVKALGIQDQADRWQFYLPFASLSEQSEAKIALRLGGRLEALIPALKGRVWQRDPNLSVGGITALETTLAESIAQPRFNTVLLSLMAAVALGLAVIGVYGVIVLSVSQRVREIGVRIALGAQKHDVLALLYRQAAVPLGIGIAAGLVAAAGLSRFLRSQLFEIAPTDPATYGIIVLVFVAVGLVAVYLPARRATRIDPVEAIRAE